MKTLRLRGVKGESQRSHDAKGVCSFSLHAGQVSPGAPFPGSRLLRSLLVVRSEGSGVRKLGWGGSVTVGILLEDGA